MAVGAVVLEAEVADGATAASASAATAAASAALASLKGHIEVWHKDSSMKGGAMIEGVVTGRDGARAVAAMGAIGVRFNSRKSYYAWSAAAARRHQLDPADLLMLRLCLQGLSFLMLAS